MRRDRRELPSGGGGLRVRTARPAWRRRRALGIFALLLLLALPAAAEDSPQAGGDYAWRPAGKAGLEAFGLSCLRIHPKNADVLWAYVHGMGPARSEDGGRTWTAMLKGVPEKMLPGLRSNVRVSFDLQKVKTMYLVIDGQIFRSEDGGDSWDSVTSGALTSLSWNNLNSTHLSYEVEVDPQKSVHLLVGTRNDGDHNGGLFESANGGKSWEQIAGTDIDKSGLGNDTFLVRQDPKSDKYVTVAGRRALWRSDNRGRNFERNDPGGIGIHDYRDLSRFTGTGKDFYVADARGIWRSKDAGKKWEKKPIRPGDALGVVVDPYNKKQVYAIFHDRGVEVGEKGGKNWGALGGHYAPDPENPGEPQTGYRNAIVRELIVHPRERKTMFLTSPVTGLHISTDDGNTFAPVQAPEDAESTALIPALVPPLALVGVHPAQGGAHLAVSEEGVVYGSADRGTSWTLRGRLGQAPGLLVPDSAPNTWWAAGRRLLRSGDDGATWAPVGPIGVDEKEDPEERIVAFHRGAAAGDKPGALHLLLERSGIVLSSADDGATWSRSKAPWKPVKGGGDRTWAADMAVNPANPAHLVIAARTTRQAPSRSDENGGLFESWDGGKSWQDITGELKPGKKDGVAAQRAKANWNRASFVGVDPISGLIVYGADGRGIFARPIVDPTGKKPATPPTWVDVSPKVPERPKIVVSTFTLTPDSTDSRLVVQLAGLNDETYLYGIAGKTLANMRAFRSGEQKFPNVPVWSELAKPGPIQVGEEKRDMHFTSLTADGQLSGRFLASEREAGVGVVIYEIPGSKPGAGAPKKGDGKEEGAQKDEEKEKPAVVLQPPEGMRAFTASKDMAIRIWRVDKAESTLQVGGHTNVVRCVVLSPDERFLVSASTDKTVRIWNASSGAPIASIPTEAGVNALVVDDDSKFAYAALADKNEVLQINLESKALKSFTGHTGPVTALAVSDDVNRVYSGSRDKTIRVWDAAEGTQVNEIAYGAEVVALAVASDGSRMFAAGNDGTLKAFDATGAEVGRLDATELGAVNAICLSPDDTVLYAAMKGAIRGIFASSLKTFTTHEAADQNVLAVTVSADDLWVFGGDEQGGLHLWGVGEAKPRWSVKTHESSIHGIAVTPDETDVPDPDAVAPADGGDKPGGDKPGGDKPGGDKPGGDAPDDGAKPDTPKVDEPGK